MALDIQAMWHQPLELAPSGIGYSLELDKIPDEPGIYVFGRTWGDNLAPLYIGRSTTLRQRLTTHLNTVKIIQAIRDFPGGNRFILFCTFELKRGQQIERVLEVVERGLIDKALTEGHELINVQGTRTPKHTINFQGNRCSEAVSGRQMFVRET